MACGGLLDKLWKSMVCSRLLMFFQNDVAKRCSFYASKDVLEVPIRGDREYSKRVGEEICQYISLMCW